jgi:hypothetical protein
MALVKNRRDLRTGEVAREYDPIVDSDVIVVHGDIEAGHRREDHAGAGVARRLGLQRLSAERERGGGVHRQRQRLERHQALSGDVDEVGGGG